jgi:hypothetical protein
MKYSNWIGVGAAVLLVISCFMAWTYHPDLNKVFNGFFSEKNIYGKPGKLLIFFAGVATLLFIIPRVWAKRGNIFVCTVALAYAIKTFILFSGCYRGVCPEKKAGLWLMMVSCVLMLAAAVFPDFDPEKRKKPD